MHADSCAGCERVAIDCAATPSKSTLAGEPLKFSFQPTVADKDALRFSYHQGPNETPSAAGQQRRKATLLNGPLHGLVRRRSIKVFQRFGPINPEFLYI